jgi:hypothetical protein
MDVEVKPALAGAPGKSLIFPLKIAIFCLRAFFQTF